MRESEGNITRESFCFLMKYKVELDRACNHKKLRSLQLLGYNSNLCTEVHFQTKDRHPGICVEDHQQEQSHCYTRNLQWNQM